MDSYIHIEKKNNMSVSSKSMTFCSLILLILCVLNIFAQDKTIILIQYLFDGEECGVTFKTHGNCRQTQVTSYVRTNRSVLVQYVFENSGPNGTVHMVSEENGGYLQATSGGDLPRNREQAKNCRSRSTKSSYLRTWILSLFFSKNAEDNKCRLVKTHL